MGNGLVLSLFPGIGLLDRAFEAEGFCVVRGPDVLWGGDIRRFHPPAGVFDGVIGGPPCQSFSALVHLVRANGHEPRFGNLIPEFERVVAEARPAWYLMENVPAAPVPVVVGFHAARTLMLNNRWVGAEQNRLRRFCFGMRSDLESRALDVSPDLVALEEAMRFTAVTSSDGGPIYRETGQAVLGSSRNVPVKLGGSGKVKRTFDPVNGGITYPKAGLRKEGSTVTASHAGSPVRCYSIAEAARLQGMPEGFLDDAPFTKEGKLKAIANGVPLPMGRAIARAIRRVMEAT